MLFQQQLKKSYNSAVTPKISFNNARVTNKNDEDSVIKSRIVLCRIELP